MYILIWRFLALEFPLNNLLAIVVVVDGVGAILIQRMYLITSTTPRLLPNRTPGLLQHRRLDLFGLIS